VHAPDPAKNFADDFVENIPKTVVNTILNNIGKTIANKQLRLASAIVFVIVIVSQWAAAAGVFGSAGVVAVAQSGIGGTVAGLIWRMAPACTS
jgi:hypothetical protein